MALIIEEDYSGFDWDATDGDQGDFPPVPEGWYPVKIVKADVKTVEGRQGTFQKLTLRMQILDGNEYAGRMIFDDIILNSKEGSRRRRALIWRRLGLVQKGAQKAAISEQDLVGRECAVEVKVVDYPKRDGTKGTKNEVTFAGYKPIEEVGGKETGEKLPEGDCPF